MSETISCYLGALFEGGRIAGGSIRQYLAPIAQRHVQCGYVPPPTDAKRVELVKSGFRREDYARRGPRVRHLPSPAAAAHGSLQRVLRARDCLNEQDDAAVDAGFALMAGKASAEAGDFVLLIL